MLSRRLVAFASILALAAPALSCGSRSQLLGAAAQGGGGSGQGGSSGGSAAQGGTAPGGGGQGAGTSDGGSGAGGTTTTTTTDCPLSCSVDLHDVIDCHGNVIAECPTDQGCAGGKCVSDACLASKLSASSYGCDYWALQTDLVDQVQGACFAAIVANTWNSSVKLKVEYQGMLLQVEAFTRIPVGQGKKLQYAPYDAGAGLAPGQAAVLFLAREPTNPQQNLPACPVPAAIAAKTGASGTGRGNAFHITADRPVVAHQMLPYGNPALGATSATLLLPVSAWGTSYVAINAYAKSQLLSGLQPSLDVLAQEDGTEVTLLPKADIVGGNGVDPAPANKPVTYHLKRGEHLQITQDAELTGSPLSANKPVGVWGGASCMDVPADQGTCDGGQQQLPPVGAMGHDYVAARYRDRGAGAFGVESPPWRIVGLVDGTQLTYDPPQNAPAEVKRGEVIEFTAPGPFEVFSQDPSHPFYLGQYMTGGSKFDGEGDPEWVNVVPTEQYLPSYVFFTEPDYPETELVVVRPRRGGGATADVVLDCAGSIQGFQPLNSHYEWARVDLVTGNFKDVGSCSTGVHAMKSAVPFGVTVWGWGTNAVPGTAFVSYAYPAGASAAKLNEIILAPVPK
jgi:hypothetical protein